MKRSHTPDDPALVNLITRAKAGDGAAHRELYGRYKEPSISRMEKQFRDLDPQQIEEAFHEAYMATVKGYQPEKAAFEPYLRKACRNKCFDMVEPRKRDTLTQPLDTAPTLHLVTDQDGDAHSDEEALLVRRLIEEWLRPRLGSVFNPFIAHYLDGVPWKELGSSGTRVQVSKKRGQIQRAFARGEADDLINQICALWCGTKCRFPKKCANPVEITR